MTRKGLSSDINALIKPRNRYVSFFWVALSSIALESWFAPVGASEPVAIIEYISPDNQNFSDFDFVYTGLQINLSLSQSLTLVYFDSCLREEIKGGRVTIGKNGSQVEETQRLSRSEAGCASFDIGNTQIASRSSAAMVFRDGMPILSIEHVSPFLNLMQKSSSLSIFEVSTGVEIFRLSGAETTIDLASHDILLTPGSTYRMVAGTRQALVQVSPEATEQPAPNDQRTLSF